MYIPFDILVKSIWGVIIGIKAGRFKLDLVMGYWNSNHN